MKPRKSISDALAYQIWCAKNRGECGHNTSRSAKTIASPAQTNAGLYPANHLIIKIMVQTRAQHQPLP
jgi:hypothetical protein